ncbi:beta-N-acetylglucosaminidase domain-containing protein [Thomasclavelia cocleata]|uniref:beta-N-acetylglucosaminidase domain-containing protein n=4 Tax=Thomasclavelia cocleata TaxID=69824 RepID=UPI00242D0DA5|nr:beta-N-acetylglucosaminidase domain-containing protein [Thomasclavelia cocleata]
MKGQMIKKLLVATMLTATLATNIPTVNVDALEKENSVENPILVPVPKSVEYLDNILSVTNSVNIKGQDVADPDALNELINYLEDNSISVNETYQEGSTTFIIGEEDDSVEGMDSIRSSLGLVDAATLKDEGYVLGIDSSDNGTILIEGKDGDGTFYGVQTLSQLVHNVDGTLKVREVKIEDEPSMTTRGTIEGFYGTPWTHQDRLDQIEFYGKTKLNTYIYAPKDDPYHRNRWRDPYPESEIAQLQEAINTARENKVDFIFSLSPGNDIKFTGATAETDYQALVTKCELMYEMGVRGFAIFYDDITNKQGTEQAAFLNRFNTEFIQAKGDIKPLITVPTEYDTNAMSNGTTLNTYTKNFSETLDSGIKVLWTGTAVVPEGIDVNNAQYVKSIYGDQIGIWWNYPVTDYITNKLGMGPIYGLDKGLADELDFLVMNPMEHADLSKISLATGADYSWNTPAYDYNESFKNSIVNIYGDLAPYMYTFANHSSRLVAGWASTGRADAPEVRALMDEFIKKNAKGEDVTAEVEALTTEFDNMILAANKLQETLTSAELSHCNSNLTKLKSLGEADKIALDLFIAIAQGNTAEVNSLKSTLQSRVNSLSSGKLVSELTALAFVKEAINYNPNAAAGFEVSNTFVLPGQEIQLTNTSSVSSTDLEWTFEGANIESSTEENPVISYAKEGVYTISLKAKNKLGEDEIIKEDIITVSNEADGNIVNLSVGKSATATSYTGASEAPNKAIDGISSTKWCATGYNRPHTLTIDLGKEVTVNSITISHAEIGGEGSGLNTRKYRVQVSIDGTNYTEVVNVSGNTAGLTTDYFQVSLARYVKLIVDEPTQGGDSAARIYEVEVKGLDKAITIPPVYNPVNKQALSVAVEMASAVTEADLENVVPAVVEEFNAALDAARIVLEDERAKQDAIDSAFERLANAMHMLEFFKGDKALLQNLVDSTADLVEEKYTEESWSALQDALTEANAVLNNVNAMQEEVDEAYDNLQAAINGLEEAEVVDKSLLEAMVNKVLGLEEDKYIASSWQAMLPELEAAQEVLGNEKATQAEVDEACDALTRGYLNLRLKPNKDLLSDLINKANGLNSASYTAKTWAVVADEVIKARAVLEDPEASIAEVKAAEAALTNAIEGLVANSVETVKTGDSEVKGSVKTGDTTSMIGALGLLASLSVIACLNKKRKDI